MRGLVLDSSTLFFDVTAQRDSFLLEAAGEVPGVGVTALFGPSGSGKSTLMRAIAGLDRDVRGVIRFGSETWLDGSGTFCAPERRRIGAVSQGQGPFPHLTVAENLRYGSRRAGVPDDQLVALHAALDIPALTDRPVSALSGGERQRVMLAMALGRAPRLVLLDEPFSALDIGRRAALYAATRAALATVGAPALLVSHDAADIHALAGRVLWMEDGKVRATGAMPDGHGGARMPVTGRITNRAGGRITVEVGTLTLSLTDEDPSTDGSIRLLIGPRGFMLCALPVPLTSGLGGGVGVVRSIVAGANGHLCVVVAAGNDTNAPLLETDVDPEAARRLNLAPGAEVGVTVMGAKHLADPL